MLRLVVGVSVLSRCTICGVRGFVADHWEGGGRGGGGGGGCWGVQGYGERELATGWAVRTTGQGLAGTQVLAETVFLHIFVVKIIKATPPPPREDTK